MNFIKKTTKIYDFFYNKNIRKESLKSDDNYENSPEDYTKLEKILQKHEGEIRNHISVLTIFSIKKK